MMAPQLSIAGHERISYSALPERKPLHWPNGARVALWVAPNIEHYEYLPEQVRVRNPWPRVPHPDILGYGLRDYGNRVGVWRLMELFDALDLPITVSLSMSVLDMYPDLAEAMMKRQWEFMSHGLYNTRYHWNMSEDDFDSVINVHLKGHWAMSHHAIKYMRREGYGRIVNFSSDAFKGSGGQCNYSAAKAGIIGLTRSIAKETARFGITCNAMCPAADTRMMMNEAVIANQKRKLEAGLMTQEQYDIVLL